jgi:hypothetical protein
MELRILFLNSPLPLRLWQLERCSWVGLGIFRFYLFPSWESSLIQVRVEAKGMKLHDSFSLARTFLILSAQNFASHLLAILLLGRRVVQTVKQL